jgi:hypothetical protein
MRRLLDGALTATAEQWEPIRRAYRWVHHVAHVLNNDVGWAAADVEYAFVETIRSMGLTKRHMGPLEPALNHFLKVTRSYRPGLFHCYRNAELPRTNNGLEQLFGQHRRQERRATGRKAAPPNSVVRGEVRLVASTVTRLCSYDAPAVAPRSVAAWRALRTRVRQRFALRAQGRRFRADPDAYLTELEATCLTLRLPV